MFRFCFVHPKPPQSVCTVILVRKITCEFVGFLLVLLKGQFSQNIFNVSRFLTITLF